MPVFTSIKKNIYWDSLQVLYTTSIFTECEGIEAGLVIMGSSAGKAALEELDLLTKEAGTARDMDLIFAGRAHSEEAFLAAVEFVLGQNQKVSAGENRPAYTSASAALEQHSNVNICTIAVPGEYAREETEKALNAGLHCVVFSNNVSLADERAMKELAREKGLLCMGPDCGVANINGYAMVLGSITNRGPFGICGASGCGIQHVAAILHKCGSGISQGIGTGGSDLKDEVGGITMLMGIDALEQDPETKYIVLISRSPGQEVLQKLLARIGQCTKPVVACLMGSDAQMVQASGAVWASDLDDCAQKALALIGKENRFETEEEILEMAQKAIQNMSPEQKYVRGAYLGGTYCDEAMKAMQEKIGGIHSNCPLSPELKLADSAKSVGNAVIDYGEEEFTLGRPHPTIDPSVRKPAILREAADPETAVLLMDFILTPAGPDEPVGSVILDILAAKEQAKSRGGDLAVVASVLGTDADLQNRHHQVQLLRQAGVLVCGTNYRAALLAGEIIRQKKERDLK
ncbi:FdrA family protein [Oscillospiraceae bacterium MB08-C2-2]|nr:FdrA family protein [Oscillospiraceae bacterium MB08-C2-2]